MVESLCYVGEAVEFSVDIIKQLAHTYGSKNGLDDHMFVEFLGASGSGKSTICRQLFEAHSRNIVVGQSACYDSLLQKTGKSQKIRAYVKAVLAQYQAKRTGDRTLLKHFGIADECVDLCNFVFQNFRVDANFPQLHFDHLRRFQSTIAWYSALNYYHEEPARRIVFDEFFSQRCLAMVAYADDQKGFISDFVKYMPKAELYVYVDSPLAILKQRLMVRDKRSLTAPEQDIALHCRSLLNEVLSAQGENILRLDGTKPVAANLEILSAVLFRT